MFELYETANNPHCLPEHLACLPNCPHSTTGYLDCNRPVRTAEDTDSPEGGSRFCEIRPAGEEELSSRLIGVSCSDISCLITRLAVHF